VTEVVTLGECLIAFVATTPGPLAEATTFERFVAGAEANVAVGLARLGHAATYIGRVGSDGFADAIRWRLRGEGVDTTHLTTDQDAPTGLMFRERRGLGPSQVVYVRRGSAGSRIAVADVDRAADAGVFRDARWLHVTGITPALSAEARAATERAIVLARDAGLTISLDLNLRRRIWSDETAAPVLRALAAQVDVVLGSHDELAVVTDRAMMDSPADLARAALALGPATAVVKMAADGALAVERADPAAAHVRPAVPLPVLVDPVGAGDAFCAGYIAANLEGATLADALDVANACGAASAAELGDQTGLPDRDRLAAILGSGIGQPGHDTIR
jgi:2-dehydro-3-deoxygluconokinase